MWAKVVPVGNSGSSSAAGAPASSALTGRPRGRLATSAFVDTDVYDYAKLRAGHHIVGPAVIEVPTTTVVVPGGTAGTVDALGNLTISRVGATS